jgi:uncharacterized integral membrane protein
MKLLRRVLFATLLVVFAIVIFQNQTSLGMPLEFSFLKWSFSLVLGFWILLAFVSGIVLFAIVDLWRVMMLRLQLRHRDQEILRLKTAAAALTAAAHSVPTTSHPGDMPAV